MPDSTTVLAVGPSTGIFSSSDYGHSWSVLRAPEACFVNYDIWMGPDGTFYRREFVSPGYNYFQSTDTLATWHAVPQLPAERYYRYVKTNDGTLISNAGSKIYRSTDNAATWTIPLNITYNYLRDLTYDRVNDRLYVIDQTHTPNSHLYMSTDQGMTWTIVFTTTHQIKLMEVGPEGNVYLHTQTSLPFTGYVYTSLDFGASWTEQQLPWIPVDYYNQNDIDLIATTTGRLIAKNRLHPTLRSDDFGATWQEAADWHYRLMFGITKAPDGSLLSTMLNTVLRSSENGENWYPAYGEVPYSDVGSMVFYGPDTLVVATSISVTYRSDDAGAHWTGKLGAGGSLYAGPSGRLYTTSGFVSTDRGETFSVLNTPQTYFNEHITGLLEAPGYLLLSTNTRLLRSPDQGATWEVIQNQGFTGLKRINDGSIVSGLWRSTDNGLTWQMLYDQPGTVLASTITNDGKIYVIKLVSNLTMLAYSYDLGSTWTEVATPIPYLFTPSGITALGSAPRLIVTSNDECPGYYMTDDLGTTWNFEEPAVQFSRFWVGPNDSLYATSRYQGFWTTSPTTPAPEPPNTARGGVAVFPNPAAEQVMFRWPELTEYQLEIFDVAGRRLFRQTGSGNTAQWRCAAEQRGLYAFVVSSAGRHIGSGCVLLR